MVLNLIILALVLASTFMQSGFGFYTAVLNLFCSIFAVTIALGFYVPVNDLLSGQLGVPTSYSDPVAIIVLFLASFAVLRTLADNYIRRPVNVHPYVDVAGSIACGFVSSQLTMGIMAICLLMLPLGGTVLQFSRFARTSDNDQTNAFKPEFERHGLWLASDAMTLAVFNAVGGGSLRGSTRFLEVYPDFLDAIWYSTNTVQPEAGVSPRREKRVDGFKDGLAAGDWWVVKPPLEGRYRRTVPSEQERQPAYKVEQYKPAPDMQIIGIDLTIGGSAADKSRTSTVHLFRPTQLRLVGKVGDKVVQAVPCALEGADKRLEGALRLVDLDNNFELTGGTDAPIRAYFEVPTGFAPDFVEYRRHARASLSRTPAETAPTGSIRVKRAGGGDDDDGESSGRRTFGSVLTGNSGSHEQLPIPISLSSLRRASNVKLTGDRMSAGRLFGAVSRFAPDRENPPAAGFAVPANHSIVHIRYKPKEARTVVGDVFNYVAKLNQYFAVDDTGERWPMSGYYAVVTRGQDQYIELFLNGPADDPLDPAFKGMLDFKDLKGSELDRDDTEICLMFIVKYGRTILRIENQTNDGGDVKIQVP